VTRFSLRPATEADFEPVLALSIRAMRPHLERIGRFDPERRRARMRLPFEAGILRIIEQDAALAGCVGILPCPDWVEVHSLFLDTHAQGQGLGEAVFRTILAEHPGRRFRLEVLKQSPARRFWERQGFLQVGEAEWEWLMERAPD
jgi:ribosomal protein S18 acetylase RimI-like enzyme